MNRLLDPRWFLILMFLGTIASVPLIQMLLEVRHEDGIRAFDVFGKTPTAENLRAYEKNLESANWAARTFRPWIQFAQLNWLRDGGAKVLLGRDGWYFYKPGVNYLLERPHRTGPAMPADDPVAAIVDFRDQLAARGIRLMILPVPNKESVYPDRLTSRANDLHAVLSPRTLQVMDRLRAAGIEVIDLFSVFARARQEAGMAATPLYLAQDTHWSPRGVEVAAKFVACRLMELGWAQPGTTDYDGRTAPVPRLGDIVRMLRLALVESRVHPENVPCVQVVRHDTGQPYTDAPDAGILVLGDSFMRVYQRDQPGAAGFVAHLARELKQPLISLVNDGGGSTLVRQELHARPAFLGDKKVVIWEFVERDIGLGLEGWKKVPLPPVFSPHASESAHHPYQRQRPPLPSGPNLAAGPASPEQPQAPPLRAAKTQGPGGGSRIPTR